MKTGILAATVAIVSSLVIGCGGGGESSTAPAANPGSAVTNSTFYMLDKDMNSVAWGFDGPVAASSALLQYVVQSKSNLTALNPDKSKKFTATSSTGISVKDNTSGNSQSFALPASYPEFSWAMDIAYDNKRNLVSIVSLGGEGYFYRFDTANNTWFDYKSVNNADYKAMAYDAINDRYVAITTGLIGSSSIHLLNSNGSFNKSIPITSLQNFDTSYTSQSSSGELRVFVLDNDVALVGTSGGIVKAIWKFNLVSQSGSKTYSAP